MELRETVRYSEAFKMQVVQGIESGRFRNMHAASKAYGIKGSETIKRWLRQYGDPDKLPKLIKVMSMKEIDESAELKKRVKDLEKALADAYMKGLLSESYLEIACEDMGADIDEFKKKHATDLLKGPRRKGSK